MIRKITIALAVVLCSTMTLHAQNAIGNGWFPITRDTLNKFPDYLVIQGEVVDFNLGISCGIFCGCGAIKIKLSKPNPNYPYGYIYLGMPCFDKFTMKLKAKKYWRLNKIRLDDKSCFWREMPQNKFDSKGLPFYTTAD